MRRAGRSRALMRRYGLTLTEWERLAEAQMYECRLCHTGTADLVVDHNHATGLVRGLLCRPCNVRLGYFEQLFDPRRVEWVERASAYVRGVAA